MPRPRDPGLTIGRSPVCALNGNTDVGAGAFGQVTLIVGSRPRTGATAIVPHGGKLFEYNVGAALNRFGKFAGAMLRQELGQLETPIQRADTLAVGLAIQVANRYTIEILGNDWVVPLNSVLGETNDNRMKDIRAARPTLDWCHAPTAGPVAKGGVGAQAGCVAFGLKGGICTVSRAVSQWILGLLVQANFGGRLRGAWS